MTVPKLKQPIQETGFLQDEIVICGKCKGRKVVEGFFLLSDKPCPLCQGTGTLNKVTRGSVSLFLTNKNQ